MEPKAWLNTSHIRKFKNTKPIAFYILFLFWAINAYTSTEDQKLMRAITACFNIVRL